MCGLPQGSILAPSLFSLYMLPVSIFRKYGLPCHLYADDTQTYLSLKKENESSVVNSLSLCLEEVKAWLSENFLFLNEEKTEVVILGPIDLSDCKRLRLGNLEEFRSPQVRNLGITLDQNLKFDKHILKVVGNSFYQHRLLSKMKSSLPLHSLKIAIHALIISKRSCS